jgi:hypothetical protein
MSGSTSRCRPVTSAANVYVTRVLGPDAENAQVVVVGVPAVVFQVNRVFGSYAVTSLVRPPRSHVPEVKNVLPTPIGPLGGFAGRPLIGPIQRPVLHVAHVGEDLLDRLVNGDDALNVDHVLVPRFVVTGALPLTPLAAGSCVGGLKNPCSSSSGNGKMIVEFFSAAISVSVWR